MRLFSQNIQEAARYRKEGKMEFAEANKIRAFGKGVRKVNDATHFVHFSDVEKLGINPQSRYNTPLGIYTYPITEEVAEDLSSGSVGASSYSHGRRSELSDFALDRKFMVFAKLRGGAKILYITRYTEEDLQKDIEKLKNKDREYSEIATFSRKLTQNKIELLRSTHSNYTYQNGMAKQGLLRLLTDLEQSAKYAKEGKHSGMTILERVMPSIFNNPIVKYNLGITEQGEGEFYREVEEAEKRNPPSGLLKYVESYVYDLRHRLDIDAKKKQKELDEKIEKVKLEEFHMGIENVIDHAIKTSKHWRPATKLWNITRLLAGENAKKWASILRSIGYQGAVDDGTGTIHPGEESQAVFFDISPLENKGVYPNRLLRSGSREAVISKLVKKPETVSTAEEVRSKIQQMIEVVNRYNDPRSYEGHSFRTAIQSLMDVDYNIENRIVQTLYDRGHNAEMHIITKKNLDDIAYAVSSVMAPRIYTEVWNFTTNYLPGAAEIRKRLEQLLMDSRLDQEVKTKVMDEFRKVEDKSEKTKKRMLDFLHAALNKKQKLFNPNKHEKTLKKILSKTQSSMIKNMIANRQLKPPTGEWPDFTVTEAARYRKEGSVGLQESKTPAISDDVKAKLRKAATRAYVKFMSMTGSPDSVPILKIYSPTNTATWMDISHFRGDAPYGHGGDVYIYVAKFPSSSSKAWAEPSINSIFLNYFEYMALANQGKLKQENIYYDLVHEYVHLIDPKPKLPKFDERYKSRFQDEKTYFNSPEEFDAESSALIEKLKNLILSKTDSAERSKFIESLKRRIRHMDLERIVPGLMGNKYFQYWIDDPIHRKRFYLRVLSMMDKLPKEITEGKGNAQTFSDKTGLYDVYKLWDVTKDRKPKEVSVEALPKVSRSKRSGFRKEQYDDADLKHPILVKGHNVVDGRHRLLKARDSGKGSLQVHHLSDKDMQSALIRAKNKNIVEGKENIVRLSGSPAMQSVFEFFWRKYGLRPAMQTPDGEVIPINVSGIHGLDTNAVYKQMNQLRTDRKPEKLKNGWVTNDRKFLTPEEAGQVLKKKNKYIFSGQFDEILSIGAAIDIIQMDHARQLVIAVANKKPISSLYSTKWAKEMFEQVKGGNIPDPDPVHENDGILAGDKPRITSHLKLKPKTGMVGKEGEVLQAGTSFLSTFLTMNYIGPTVMISSELYPNHENPPKEQDKVWRVTIGDSWKRPKNKPGFLYKRKPVATGLTYNEAVKRGKEELRKAWLEWAEHPQGTNKG